MKTLFAILLGVTACVGVLRAQPLLLDGIKAVVHDTVVTHQEVAALTAPATDLLLRRHRNEPEVFEQERAKVAAEYLDQLVERQLIVHDFETAGYNLPESIIDEMMRERIRERFGGDRRRMIQTLQAQGLTYEQFRQQAREQFIVEALRARNIASVIVISPHKLESYYLANQDKFKLEDQVKLRMIVLNKTSAAEGASVRKLAEEILSKLHEGAAFAEMAAVYSQGSQRAQGGDWGWVEKSVLRKELADVAFGLTPGKSSDVIDRPEACYLMLVEEKRPAHVRPLGEVRDEIERTLIVEERERLQKRYVDKLRAKTFVRYF